MLNGCSRIHLVILDTNTGDTVQVTPPLFNQYRQFLLGGYPEKQVFYGIQPYDTKEGKNYLMTCYNMRGEIVFQKDIPVDLGIPFIRWCFFPENMNIVFVDSSFNATYVDLYNVESGEGKVLIADDYKGFIYYGLYKVNATSFIAILRNFDTDAGKIIYYDFEKEKLLSEITLNTSTFELIALSAQYHKMVIFSSNHKNHWCHLYDFSSGKLLQKISFPAEISCFRGYLPEYSFSPIGNAFLCNLKIDNIIKVYRIYFDESQSNFKIIILFNLVI